VALERWSWSAVRARLTGSWFWGASLTGACVVPLLALRKLSGWICVPSAVVLVGCGLAALLDGSPHRVGDMLLATALVVVLLLVFLDPGPTVQMGYAAVLGGAGLAIRSAARRPTVTKESGRP